MANSSSMAALRARWLTFVVVFIVAVLAAVAVTILTPKTYTANAQVLVTARVEGNAATRAQANNYVQAQVPSYAKVVASPDVIAYVRGHLNPNISDSKVRGELSATAAVNSSVIDIVVTDSSASRSAALANSASRGFVAAIERYDSSTQLFLTGPAQTPSSPTSPRRTLNIALGILLGLVLGAVAASLRAASGNRSRSPEHAAPLE